MTSPAAATITCPSCGANAHGRFCAECGAPLAGATCAECAAPLTPGAKFCHRCGLPAGQRVGGRSDARMRGAIPWAVAAIALLAVISMVASRNLTQSRGSALDGPQNAIPTPGLDDRGGSAPRQQETRAPDISALTPEQAADRLFDRIMRLDEEGKTDSVQFFAPMAITSYGNVGSLNPDQRFHLGMIALATRYPEMVPAARAQADTILRADRNHLLGLTLALRSARAARDSGAIRDIQRRLAAAAPTELPKQRPEYEQHRPIIDDAVSAARAARTP